MIEVAPRFSRQGRSRDISLQVIMLTVWMHLSTTYQLFIANRVSPGALQPWPYRSRCNRELREPENQHILGDACSSESMHLNCACQARRYVGRTGDCNDCVQIAQRGAAGKAERACNILSPSELTKRNRSSEGGKSAPVKMHMITHTHTHTESSCNQLFQVKCDPRFTVHPLFY